MELRLAEGVTRSRIMGRNGLAKITRLSLTPTAKRNSYRVAILVGALPRVAGCARNPGLCNRNSVRVAGGAYFLLYQKGMNEYGPSLTLTKRRENQSATG